MIGIASCAAGSERIIGKQQHLRGRRRAGDPDPPAAAQEEAGPPVPAQGGRRRGQEARAGAQAAGEAAPADAIVPARPGRRVADVGADHRADGVRSGGVGQCVPVSRRFRRAWRRLAGLIRRQRGRQCVAKRRNS